jgi:Helix-turn-helix of DDE superfamily endonuclease
VIAYRAMLDVPRELVSQLAGLLRAERKRRGTRRGSRALSCWRQALLGLVWFRKNEEMTVLAAGFGIGRATAYRYRDEIVTVLSEQAPDLHEALHQVADEGWSHVILDGKVFRTDRCAETTTSTKGKTIHSWYSGKHRAFGGNIQAIMRPDGVPVWTSEVVAGHDHDLTAAPDGAGIGCVYSGDVSSTFNALWLNGRLGTGPAVDRFARNWGRRSPCGRASQGTYVNTGTHRRDVP